MSLLGNKAAEQNWKRLKEACEYLKSLSVLGLPEILEEIKNVRKSGLYEELLRAVVYHKNDNTEEVRPFTQEELSKDSLVKLGMDNLPDTGLLNLKDVVDRRWLISLYSFMGAVYFMNVNRPLNWEDELHSQFGGLDKRLVFALDKFDEVEPVPEPTAEFFQKLAKTKWKDEKSKELYKKLTLVMDCIQEEIFGLKFSFNTSYRTTEDIFIQLLAGCNAVNHGRVEMNQEDILTAYRTFFKLIKSDVTKYKAQDYILKEIMPKDYKGKMVCRKCGSVYELQPGESPDDFSGECQCGGELVYVEDKERELYFLDYKFLVLGALISVVIQFFILPLIAPLFGGFIAVFLCKKSEHGFKNGFLVGIVAAVLILILVTLGIKISNIQPIIDLSVKSLTYIFTALITFSILGGIGGKIGNYMVKLTKKSSNKEN